MKSAFRVAPSKLAMRVGIVSALVLVFADSSPRAGAAAASQNVALIPVASHPQSAPEPSSAEYRALLDRYCVSCHSDRLKTGGLTLQKLDLAHVADGAEVWEKVIAKVRSGAMPPVGRPRPEKTVADGMVKWLESEIDQAAAGAPNPGRLGVHRMNRAEYVNAIRDLLAVDIDGRALLPADDASYGFDNIADALSVSSGLLDRYLIVAQKISRLAVGDPNIHADGASYKRVRTFRQNERVSEDAPFGTRGGLAFRHAFPVDGEYSLQVMFQRVVQGGVRGTNEPNILDVRLDGKPVKQFTIFCDPRGDVEVDSNGEDICSINADANLKVRLPVKAGERVVSVSFVDNPWLKEGLEPDNYPLGSHTYGNNKGAPLAIETVEVTGPFNISGPGNALSRQRLFVCSPKGTEGELPCARKILSTVARRAYRRPVTEDDLKTLMIFYKKGSPKGFDAGIESALERVLIDPDFLFRSERDPSGVKPAGVYRVDDLALASRLSFFLRSSSPDDELLGLAERGKLKDPSVLNQQVKRLLTDPTSKELVTNFGGQWLFLRNLRSVAPDNRIFPDFDDNLREDMQQETELFFEDQLRGDHSVVDMLRANYTFVNQRLAEHYGFPNVYGSHFRRVTYPDDRRAGILGQAGVLLATNQYPDRTSPVKRGVWLLDNILGAPSPSPPADVPPFPEEQPGKFQTVRERLEEHRKNPSCAVCHARIDPLGLAMENFDPVGQWRDREGNSPINSSGQLPDGTKFNGPIELRKLLLSRQDEFIATVTKKLLTYALGRGLEYYDMPAVRKIIRDASANDYRWSSIISGIVDSVPFQMRRSPS